MTRIKVFLFGIGEAGKTAITETMNREDPFEKTKPTLAVIMSKMLVRNAAFIIWDVPGQISLRTTWNASLKGSKLLIFVLDTANKERFDESKNVFLDIINDRETLGIPLIFCFHKMDLQAAKDNLIEAQEFFDLNSIENRKVNTLETSIHDKDSMNAIRDSMASNIIG